MDNSPNFKSEPPATQPDAISQPPLRRATSEETERPPSAQQARRDSDEHAGGDQDDEEELDSDPAEKIVEFDWDELHERYHEAMKGCHDAEGELAQEWESLMSYFRIWAESGHEHETDRTFQRLRTRTTHVQNSEDRLERTRNHYIDVVKAFESALHLLKQHGFGG
ncbi:hypothetical protein EK21DRAFT_53574 [Setomelanomma holmii]|uniref:Uncharacterized protein n=1 Tax=Setomelanomma holmii TaxID=210430 RepID=A0A9P4HJX8_9PLEO|nr:hypothetical protein EK21DRAFT_53574 [Setomelanomma holmii]